MVRFSITRNIYRYMYNIIYEFLHKLYIKASLDKYVIGSNLSSGLDKYISISINLLTVSTLCSLSILNIFLIQMLGFKILLSVLLSLVATFIFINIPILFILITIPILVYKNRGYIIEYKLPILISTIAFLSSAGLSLHDIILRIKDFMGRDYKFFSVELDIIKSCAQIGIPLDKVLKNVASLTPSPSFRELLLGFSSLSIVGADIASYVETMFNNYISRYELAIERAVNSLNVYMEIYIAIALLLPVLAGSLAILFILFPVLGLTFEAITALVTLVLVPISSIAIIVLTDILVSRLRL